MHKWGNELKIAFFIAIVFHVVLFSIAFPEAREFISKPRAIIEVSLVKCMPLPAPSKPKVVCKKKKKKKRVKKFKKKIIKKIKPKKKPEPRPKKVVKNIVAAKYVETKKELPVVQPEEEPVQETLIEEESKEEDKKEDTPPGGGFTSLAKPAYGTRTVPRYPRIARRRGYQGIVVLKVLVSERGEVEDIQVLKSSGFSILDKSAVKEVKKWRFIPAKRGDTPVSCWVEIPIKYQLIGG